MSCIWPWHNDRPQDTSNCFRIGNSTHPSCLVWCWQALSNRELHACHHWCQDRLGIGKVEPFYHRPDISMLIYGNSSGCPVMFDFWNPKNHLIGLLSVISQNFFISVSNLSSSSIHFDIMAMSSVATATMVCSTSKHQKKMEWSTTDPNQALSWILYSFWGTTPCLLA